jgi:superoxide dismutase, Cu-Zn family
MEDPLIPIFAGKEHGFHIHQFGISINSFEASERCGSTGGHFNPTGVNHGFMSSKVHHAGDIANVRTSPKGTIIFETESSDISLFGERSVLGRAFVLHKDKDDGGLVDNDGSRKTGNAGPRLACGDISLTA